MKGTRRLGDGSRWSLSSGASRVGRERAMDEAEGVRRLVNHQVLLRHGPRHEDLFGWMERRPCSCYSTGRDRTIAEGVSDGVERGKVIVVAGPTGVGKTAVSLALAKRLVDQAKGAEVISADSVQVYQGLDVGSRKLPEVERHEFASLHGVPHHLIDVLTPGAQYTAGDFHAQARRKTLEILARGKTPIVVGGTGFWLRWYVQGRPTTPRSEKRSREEARRMIEEARDCGDEERQWERAAALLTDAGDPETAERLNRNDYFRLERALEIVLSTGKPMKAHLLENQKREGGEGKGRGASDFDFRCFFLYPKSRLELYQRLDESCEEMVLGGLMRECVELLNLGLMPATSTSTNAVGYRQFMEYLVRCSEEERRHHPREDWTPSSEDFLETFSDFQKQTRRLAQDQLTWFRNETGFEWVPMESDEEEAVAKAVETIWSDFTSTDGDDGGPRQWDNTGMGYLSRDEEKELKGYKGRCLLTGRDQGDQVRGTVMDQVKTWVTGNEWKQVN